MKLLGGKPAYSVDVLPWKQGIGEYHSGQQEKLREELNTRVLESRLAILGLYGVLPTVLGYLWGSLPEGVKWLLPLAFAIFGAAVHTFVVDNDTKSNELKRDSREAEMAYFPHGVGRDVDRSHLVQEHRGLRNVHSWVAAAMYGCVTIVALVVAWYATIVGQWPFFFVNMLAVVGSLAILACIREQDPGVQLFLYANEKDIVRGKVRWKSGHTVHFVLSRSRGVVEALLWDGRWIEVRRSLVPDTIVVNMRYREQEARWYLEEWVRLLQETEKILAQHFGVSAQNEDPNKKDPDEEWKQDFQKMIAFLQTTFLSVQPAA